MTYMIDLLVEASDYNSLIGSSSTTSAATLNPILGTGSSTLGYGQATIGNVTVGSSVNAINWTSLINLVGQLGKHQGTTLRNISFPYRGSSITFLSQLQTNLNSVYSSRLNAVNRGANVTNTVTSTQKFNSALKFTHTITFSNGDAARYFFNAGGQIVISCNGPSGGGRINRAFEKIAENLGKIYISAPTSGNCKIENNFYEGVTQVDGEDSQPATLKPEKGYYGLATANTVIVTQRATNTNAPWRGLSNIEIIAKTNGTQGANGDNGSIITIYTNWNVLPVDNKDVNSGASTTCTLRYPSSSAIGNSWGAATINGIVVAQSN